MGVSEAEATALVELATRVAREAGERAASGQRDVRAMDNDTKSSPTDVVTAMDREVERLIHRRLLSERPHDAFLGEEGGDAAGPGGAAVRWIVDPIDGTVNYLYGRPDWAVSVAAEVDGVVVAGAVEAPRRGETYQARLGGGALRNGEPLAAPDPPELPLALVATGFGYAAPRRAQQARVLQQVLPQVRDIRRAGVATLDLCAVATGEVDAYYERGLNPWDWAAAALVATEAGARVGGLDGRPANPELTIAARGALFDELHDVLRPLGADSDGD